MQGITKHFPGLVALSQVDFSVIPGEIHALLGQNGAGKSTLMKILAGVYPLEQGSIRIDGETVRFNHPRDALRAGVGTVYQDLSLVPHLSVAANMFLGRESGSALTINQAHINVQAEQLLARLGVEHIPVRARASSLSLAHQQLVEIAKVFSYAPRILVLDEPTAALAEEETALLFRLLDGLRQQGVAIIFISHRFKEVLQHCDRATVLRNGTLVKTVDLQGLSETELIELTIGAPLETFFHSAENVSKAENVLEVEALSVGRAVHKVSFELRRGEILSITGLLGAGQNELVRALFGVQSEVSGLVRRGGQPVLIYSPRRAIELGIGLLTEHRKREGLMLDLDVRANMTLPSLFNFRRAGLFLRSAKERKAVQGFIERLRIKVNGPTTKVATLSGGNQQKVILARWLLRDLDILLFIAPTQGIDVGAKAEIYQQMRALTRSGKSIIVVSEDLVEVLGISDRILVMYGGRLIQNVQRSAVTESQLLAAIQGTPLERAAS